MKKSTHSKIKNTGILFELLTRQITADTMTGVKNSPALKIIKEYFAAKTALAKELVLYQTLLNEQFRTPQKATMLLNTTIKMRRSLNEKALNNSKYDLIKEIKKHYDLKDFFKSTINNYKVYASVYRVFEGAAISQAADVVRSRATITEHITKVSEKPATKKQEFLQEDEEVRVLAYKLMLEKFNTKYAKLSDNQQVVLREYINNISNTTTLRDFVIKESASLQAKLSKKLSQVKDQVITIKLTEVMNLLDNNKKIKRVKEDHVHSLLLYHELLKEL
jgi:hypothetical protein|tara:strand:- start:416 stop:1246 length:831 start_codon:yes stop_codon:yes gene_type:complete